MAFLVEFEMAMQFGCLEQLIWIDIHGCQDVLGQRQFVERLAHDPAQPHDGFTAQQNVKTKLSLKLFERCRRGVTEYEFRTERFS